MNNVRIDEKFNEVLMVDPIQQVESFLGKNHNEFNNEDGMTMLSHAFAINKIKNGYLQSLGDTHFGMKWNEFLEIIKSYGFKEALHYSFDYENNKKEQAIIYYHAAKGLVIWATSYSNGASVNGGTLYGQVRYNKPVEFVEELNQYSGKPYNKMIITEDLKQATNCLNGCSHDAIMDIGTGITFSCDIREALINKITSIDKSLDFCSPWVNDHFLWFVDFLEDDKEGYDYKSITLEKIKRCPEEFQRIVKSYTDKYLQ